MTTLVLFAEPLFDIDIQDIRLELLILSKRERWSSIYKYDDIDNIEMKVCFCDGTVVRLTPTFWGCGSFTGFHYTTSNKEYWLDGEDDKGLISKGHDYINDAADFVEDEAQEHGGIQSVQVVADI